MRQGVLRDCLENDPLKRKELSEIDFLGKSSLNDKSVVKTTMQKRNDFQETPALPLQNEDKTEIIDNEPVVMHSHENELNPLTAPTTIGLELASIWQRVLNMLIDTVIVFIVFIIVGSIAEGLYVLFIDEYGLSDSFYDGGSIFAVFFILYFLYYIILESLWKNQTFGKMITKTKVVRVNKRNLSHTQIVGRTVVRILLGRIDWISLLFNKKTLHDLLSKTEVVKIKKR